jgi:hypothetical protein
MARGDREDKAVEGKDFVWVDMKDTKGNIVKDGKGNAVKTRKFGMKAEPAPAAAKPAAKKKAAPKAAPKMAPKASATATTGAGKAATANVNVSRSGASRSAANKVQPKKEAPVPGRAIVMAIKNAFTGNGETDAAKISASGNKNLGRSSTAKTKTKPAMAPNRASVAKKK